MGSVSEITDDDPAHGVADVSGDESRLAAVCDQRNRSCCTKSGYRTPRPSKLSGLLSTATDAPVGAPVAPSMGTSDVWRCDGVKAKSPYTEVPSGQRSGMLWSAVPGSKDRTCPLAQPLPVASGGKRPVDSDIVDRCRRWSLRELLFRDELLETEHQRSDITR